MAIVSELLLLVELTSVQPDGVDTLLTPFTATVAISSWLDQPDGTVTETDEALETLLVAVPDWVTWRREFVAVVSAPKVTPGVVTLIALTPTAGVGAQAIALELLAGEVVADEDGPRVPKATRWMAGS